jgi:hypothetical protein
MITVNEMMVQIVDDRAKSLTDNVVASKIKKRKLLALDTI